MFDWQLISKMYWQTTLALQRRPMDDAITPADFGPRVATEPWPVYHPVERLVDGVGQVDDLH